MFNILTLLLTLLITPAEAQTCPTRPAGDSTNACASTAFVHSVVPVTPITVPNGGTGQSSFTANLPLIGNGTGAVAQGTRSGNTTVFGTINGTLNNGHCVSIDSNGNLVDAGGSCSIGGGGGTVNSGTAGQLAYYPGSTNAVSGTSPSTFISCPVVSGLVSGGVTDNATALNAALAALPTGGGCLSFPPGKYAFNSNISYTFANAMSSVTLVGAGADVTILYWPNTSGGLTFNWANFENNIHIRSMSLTTAQAGTATAINLVSTINSAGYQQNSQNDITNVTIQGDGGTNSGYYWQFGVKSVAVSYINFVSDLIFGGAQTGTGIYLSDDAGGTIITANFNIIGCSLLDLNYGVEPFNDPQGIAITGSTFVNNNYGLITGGSRTMVGLSIGNSNFGNVKSNITISNQVTDLLITGTLFIANDVTNTYDSVLLGSVSRFTITGNDFWAAAATNQAHLAVTNSNGWPGVIIGNIFTGSTYGVYLAAATTLINVQANSYSSGTTTQVSNGGTGNFIGVATK